MLDRLSIRARLTAAFAAAMLLILALAAVFVYLTVESDLEEALDESLSARADDVAALVGTREGGIDGPRLDVQRVGEDEEGFAQLVDADGRLLRATVPEAEPAITAGEAASAADRAIFITREQPGIDGEARILARPAGEVGTSVVVVGASTEDNEETLAGLAGAFAVGAPVALLLASGLGYVLAGRGLAPIEAMRRRAGEITLEHSGERLPLPPADDEVCRLGQTLNSMLDRIEASLERERVFVADASHELRTPLANLRAELELANRPGRSANEMRAALLSAAEEVDRLSRLAEDLLVIARSEQGRLPIRREPVELLPLLERVRERFGGSARERGRELAIDARAGATAKLDPLRIEQALGNLVDNALRHGEGPVRLSAALGDGMVRLEVSDRGPGFPAGFEELAFERLTRADGGRSGGGAGLGLAIVRAIAAAHGGSAEVTGDGGSATTVRISVNA